MIHIDSDSPIKDEKEDRFNRTGFAHRIADLIVDRQNPSSIALGIHAPWGEGKTSVLNLIIQRFQSTETLYLEFNPWRYSTEDKLLRNFFFALAKKIGVSLETRAEKAGGFMRKLSKYLGLMKILGLNADEAIVALSAIVPDAEIEELKERIEKRLSETNKRVVVIMDDIDRLATTEIQALFRIVKLTANFPNIGYILSFDEKRVADAMKEQYGGDLDAGKNFLEKILQVSLPLPPASSRALGDFTSEVINSALESNDIELSKEQKHRFSELFFKAFGPSINTPRQIKRLSNELNFAFPLLKGEVDIMDLLFVESIKVLYPWLYEVIKENGELILDYTVGDEILGQKNSEFEGVISDSIMKALEIILPHKRKGIEALLQDLFPGLSKLNVLAASPQMGLRGDEQKQRISMRNYFGRYFSYGVQPHDVRDNVVKNLLRAIPNLELEEINTSLAVFVNEDHERLHTLVSKLRLYEDDLDEDSSAKLARALSSFSDKFPDTHPDDRTYGYGLMSECARLLVHLSNRLSEPKKSRLLKRIAMDTPSISFAYEFVSMVRVFGKPLKTTDDAIAVIANGIEREINKIVVSRIANYERTDNLSENHFFYVQDLYFFWFNNDFSSLREYLFSCLESDAACLRKLLAGFFQINVKADIEFSTYIRRTFSPWIIVRSLIDFDLLEEKFLQMFPDLDDNSDMSDPIRRLASNFVREYKKEVSARTGKHEE
jgi:predicted KAP-like P-loop ATPase